MHEASEQARRRLAKLALTVFLALTGIYLSLRFGVFWYFREDARIPGDYNVYWLTAERLDASQLIYNPSDGSPFKYSPTFAYLFRSTFYLLEKKLATVLWIALSTGAFLSALLHLCGRMIERADSAARSWKIAGSVILAVALSWHGFLETLGYGQVDLLLGAGLLVIAAQALSPPHERNHRRAALLRAALWAALLMTKPHLGLVLLPACLVFGPKDLLWSGLLTALTYALPILWLDPVRALEMFGEWIHCLRVQQDVTFMTGNINQSAAAVLARLFGNPNAVGLLGVAGILLYGGLLAWIGFRKDSRRISAETAVAILGAGIAGYLLFSPLSWRWFVFLWIPLVGITAFVRKNVRMLAPWALLAILAKGEVAAGLGLDRSDAVSFGGVYLWATLWLFLLLISAASRDFALTRK